MANVQGAVIATPQGVPWYIGPDAPAINNINPVLALGTIVVASNGNIYRYCQAGDAWTVVDGALIQSSSTTGFRLSPSGTTATGEQLGGVVVNAVTDEYFGWALVYGKVAAMTCAALKAITAQLAIVCCTTAARMENYAAATHTAAGPGGVAEASIAADAAGVITALAF